MQDGVKRAGTDFVTVTLQLLDHGEAVDRLLRRMVKNVEPDQPGIEILVLHRPRYTYFVIGIR